MWPPQRGARGEASTLRNNVLFFRDVGLVSLGGAQFLKIVYSIIIKLYIILKLPRLQTDFFESDWV